MAVVVAVGIGFVLVLVVKLAVPGTRWWYCSFQGRRHEPAMQTMERSMPPTTRIQPRRNRRVLHTRFSSPVFTPALAIKWDISEGQDGRRHGES